MVSAYVRLVASRSPQPPRARSPAHRLALPGWAEVTFVAAFAHPSAESRSSVSPPELCTPRDERGQASRCATRAGPGCPLAQPAPPPRGRSRRDAAGRKRRRPARAAGKEEPPARWAPRPAARTPRSRRVGAGRVRGAARRGRGRESAAAGRAVFVSPGAS